MNDGDQAAQLPLSDRSPGPRRQRPDGAPDPDRPGAQDVRRLGADLPRRLRRLHPQGRFHGAGQAGPGRGPRRGTGGRGRQGTADPQVAWTAISGSMASSTARRSASWSTAAPPRPAFRRDTAARADIVPERLSGRRPDRERDRPGQARPRRAAQGRRRSSGATSPSTSPRLSGRPNVLGMNFLSSLSGWGVEGKWLVLKP